jgi:carbonic anhydrase
MTRSLRMFVKCAAVVVCMATLASSRAAGLVNIDADEAMQRLRDGNARFVQDKMTHPRQQADRRAEIAKGQKPWAIVVCCSDSRVGPEIVFDQGLGDLFVMRTAGEVVDDVGLGSIEYAVEHFGTRLVVVLGHSRCGAVAAALSGGENSGHVDAVVKAIRPAIETARGESGDPLDNAIRANVRTVVRRLATAAPILSARSKDGRLRVVGACYDLDSGRVEMMK